MPVSVEILDGLSIAAGPRVTFVNQSSNAPMPGSTMVVEQELSGTHFSGITAGIHYEPIPELSLGFTYRSRVDVETSGTTTMGGEEFETRSSFSAPHAFRFGIAGKLFRGALQMTVDLKYLLYSDSNRSLTTSMMTPDGEQSSTLPLDWQNAISVNGGIEYWPFKFLATRVGYAVSSSATPVETANAFTTPPSEVHSIHVGLGVLLGDFSVDAGGYYAFSSRDVETTESTPGGSYSLDGILGAFSATYAF